MKFFLKIFFISAIIFAAVFVVLSGVLKKQAHAAGYSYSRAITVTSNTSIASGTQANFPMLVSSTISSWATVSHGGHVQNLVTAPNGGQEPADLIFTSDSGCSTPLNFETESYSSSTGALVDWVNVPSLSAGTVIYACYGNTSVTTDQSHPSSTWNPNYKAVFHLASPTGTLSTNDSTSNMANGTNNGATATASGQIDGAAGMNGTSQYVDVPMAINYSAATFELWFNSSNLSAGSNPRLLANQQPGDGDGFLIYYNNGGGQTHFYLINANGSLDCYFSYQYTNNTWYNLVATYNGTAMIVYLNGVNEIGTGCTGVNGNLDTSSYDVNIGRDPAYAGDYFPGTVDEARILNVALTQSWITSEYNNQNSPSTFYTIGSEQTMGGGSSSYSYSRAITVTSNTSIASGTQANFPMLVSSTISSWASASNGGHVQNLVTAPNGGQEPADFIFTSDSGCSSPLNFETESYSSSTGALVDWVNVPSLSAGTVIYACYGNAAVTTDQSNPSATWNANYQFVYHFPTVPGGSLNAFDSTQFANAATTQNNVAATASGLAGGGIFYSSNYGSNLENSYTQTNVSTYTEEAWIKTSEVNGFVQPIIDDRNGFASPSMSLFLEGSGACGGSCGPAGSGDLVVGMDTDNVFYGDYASAEALTDGNWHHVVATLSQAIGTAIVPASFNLYIDGVQQSLTPINLAGQIYSPFTASGGTWVGYEPAWSYNFEGTMDEVRVSTAALSPSWIATEYNNQNNPSAFYAVGSENANAASSFTWTGAGGNANWSTGANWSGGAAPGATSTATFDGTCSSNCSPTIDTSINIGGISMSSAYHGTITQASGSSITIGSSGFTQGGGTFVASANRDAITVNGSFTESAGMFTSTAGNLTIAGDMMLSGQTFNANGGTTTLDANGYSPTLTCGSSSLGSLTIAITGGTLNIPNNCTVAGNLLSNSGGVFEKPSSTATVAVRGNFTQTGGLFGEANLTLSLVGSATSTIAQSIGTTIGANLNISKTGTIPVQLASDLIVTGANCTVSTGTLDMNSHSFTCFGALAINSGGWLADYPTATSTLTTGAGVTNNGVMFLDGTGLGYASPYPRYMNILSTVSGTQSYWSSGAGEFIIRSATIKDQGGTFTKGASQIPVWNGALTNDSGELFVPSSVGRPQLVESTTPAWSGSGVSSLALPAFTYWPKAGDLILVAVSAYGQTIVAPTDNASNTYLLATSTTFGSPSNAVSLYYAQNVNSTSSFVVTLHATVPSGGIQLLSGQAYEFTGMAATSTFDAASQNIDTSGSAVSLSSGNATGRSAHDELFFGAATIGSTIATVTGTPFSGWTSLSGVPSTGSQQGLFPEYQSVPSPSTLAAPWSASTSTTYGAVLGVFDSPAGSRGYAASGTLDSAIFDTKSVLGAQLNSVVWYGSALNGTSVGLQFAVSNSSAGPWTFEGPSGDATTYFAGAAGSSIPLVSNIGGAGYSMFSGYEYFRYRLLFSSDPTHMYTPTVTGVNVNWSP